MKGNEPPDSPPPPYSRRSSPESSDMVESGSEDKFSPLPPEPQPHHQPHRGPIIHGPKPQAATPPISNLYRRYEQHQEQFQNNPRFHWYLRNPPAQQAPTPPLHAYPQYNKYPQPPHPSQTHHHPHTGHSPDCASQGAGNSGVIIGQPQPVRRARNCVDVDDEYLVESPKTYLALSIVTCLFFSPLFGFIAICLSAFSHTAFDNGNREASKLYGKTALGLNLAGISLSLVILIFLLFRNGIL